MKLKVLIADDELLSRARLRQFLQEDARAEVVAECATGQETLRAIRQTSPDLVFLDVKMPELDGLAVLQRLPQTRLPVVIFVTAHHEFAVRAFEAHAVDYLLKPFDRPRFQTALSRALERLHAIAAGIPEMAAAGEPPASPTTLDRLVVKSGGRISLVNAAQIDWISAADNYIELHVAKASHFVRMTLTELEQKLPPKKFQRISRSHLVNLDRIKEIRPRSHGDATVVLHTGEALPVSRNLRRTLLRSFAGPH